MRALVQSPATLAWARFVNKGLYLFLISQRLSWTYAQARFAGDLVSTSSRPRPGALPRQIEAVAAFRAAPVGERQPPPLVLVPVLMGR